MKGARLKRTPPLADATRVLMNKGIVKISRHGNAEVSAQDDPDIFRLHTFHIGYQEPHMVAPLAGLLV